MFTQTVCSNLYIYEMLLVNGNKNGWPAMKMASNAEQNTSIRELTVGLATIPIKVQPGDFTAHKT